MPTQVLRLVRNILNKWSRAETTSSFCYRPVMSGCSWSMLSTRLYQEAHFCGRLKGKGDLLSASRRNCQDLQSAAYFTFLLFHARMALVLFIRMPLQKLRTCLFRFPRGWIILSSHQQYLLHLIPNKKSYDSAWYQQLDTKLCIRDVIQFLKPR